MRVKNVVLLSCIAGLSFLYGCNKTIPLEEVSDNSIDSAALEELPNNSVDSVALEEAVANYDVKLIMSENELAAIDWSDEILPYMEYDWLSDENIERYFDSSWTMQLADLNQDGQQEMLVTVPIYHGEDLTYIYTVEDESVIYCGKMVAGAAYRDNVSFVGIGTESYLPTNYIDAYKNESGEIRYISGSDYLMEGHGYYQIYENTFDGKSVSCEPIFAIEFAEGSDGARNYNFITGDRLEREKEEADDEDFSVFIQAMEEYMEGYEKIDISFTVSEFRVPGIVNELSEKKKEIVRNNIKAGFAKVLESVER